MKSTHEELIRRKFLSRAGFEPISSQQLQDMELATAIPSASDNFHRKRIVFQIFHLNTHKKRDDHWDRIHQDLGMSRSSLRNAILDNRLVWDPEKDIGDVSKGKPHFEKIKTAEFFPVIVITQMEERGPRLVEYVKLADGKNYRVVYEWRERESLAGEYDARIITLHVAGDKRGRKFIESSLSLPPPFISENRYAIWFPTVTGKNEESGSLVAVFDYP